MSAAPSPTTPALPFSPMDLTLALILGAVAKRDRMKRRDRMASSIIDDVLAQLDQPALDPAVIRFRAGADADTLRQDAERRRLCSEARNTLNRVAPLARALSESQ